MRIDRKVPLAILSVAAAVSCSQSEAPSVENEASDPIATVGTAILADREGNRVAVVSLIREGDALFVSAEIENLGAGTKAFHLHAKGDCSASDFTSAEGHLNPAGNTHGSLSEGGKHLGDLPNIEIAKDGTATAEFPVEGAASETLGEIFDEDGTAVMIHEGPDDYLSDPAGAAGPRIACGVITSETT